MRVLYVEDDDSNRDLMRRMLERRGVEVFDAEEAETGLWMAAANDYDLIFMDVRLPGLDGLSAIRRIRARGDARSRVPIVVVTADSSSDIHQRSTAAGADDTLLKPINADTLFEKIAQVFAKRGERRPDIRAADIRPERR